jgi:RES domain-containing protein
MGERQAIGIEALLPRHLYRYEVSLLRVLDLTAEATRRALDIEQDVLMRSNWSACQDLGTIAHNLSIQAINSPSATGVGEVLAVSSENVEENDLNATFVEEWRQLSDARG